MGMDWWGYNISCDNWKMLRILIYRSNNQQRVPISSDILIIESWLEPGTVLIIDGRVANVRYLKSKLIRNWEWATDVENDVTIAILNETPLGHKSSKDLKERGFIS